MMIRMKRWSTRIVVAWPAGVLGLGMLLSGASALAQADLPEAPTLAAQALLARDIEAPLWLLGEQHDAPAHAALAHDLVQGLAARARLRALLIEMAERGHTTQGLSPQADEAMVRQALAWSDGWPWARYGPVVMAAVRAGVPVVGANLPRAQMRERMQDTTLDTRLPPAAMAQQRQAMRDGHCGLLPENQIDPMARIQVARDLSMAEVAAVWLPQAAPGEVVLLLAGRQHVRRDVGLPAHLGAQPLLAMVMDSGPDASVASLQGWAADTVWRGPAHVGEDHCAQLRRRWGR